MSGLDRKPTGAPFLALAVLAALVWFGLGMNRGVLLSSDVKSRCWPWEPEYAAGAPLQAPLLSDPVWQFVPWLTFARAELLAGRLPLWNPHQDGGVPLLGDGQSALLSPLMVPALVLGVASGWNLSLLLRVLTAASGLFLLLRDIGRSAAASALAGAALALSGPFIAWLEHPHTLAVACLPWLLWSARRLLRRPGRGDLLAVAAATFAVLASGHPETTLMALLLAAAYVAMASTSLRAAGRVAAAASLGALLAAPAVLPLAEYFLLSEARIGIGRRAMTLGMGDLVRVVLPLHNAANPVEGGAYLGVVVILLAVVGAVLGRGEREARFWCVVVAVTICVAFENPLASWLAVSTPIYWTRALLLAPIPVAALAAGGLDRLRSAMTGRVLGAWPAGALLLVPALAIVDLLIAARGVHAVTPASELERTTPLLRALESDRTLFRILPLHTFLPPNAATDYGLDDLRGYDALAPRGWRAQRAAIGRFSGVAPVSDAVEPWDLAPGGRALDYWNVKYLLVHPQLYYGAEALNHELGLDLEEAYAGVDGIILRNRSVMPRARLLGGGETTVTMHDSTRWAIEVNAPAEAVLEVANPFFPGWRATVDGAAVPIGARPGEAVRLPVPPGRHRVELRYRPLPFAFGVVLALAGVAALAGWVVSLSRTRAA